VPTPDLPELRKPEGTPGQADTTDARYADIAGIQPTRAWNAPDRDRQYFARAERWLSTED